jgi:type II secretory pathway component PulF
MNPCKKNIKKGSCFMARPNRKNVYERIEDKKLAIKETEETLARLNEELQELFNERDKLEMEKLFAMMKENGLTIDKALELLQSNEQANDNPLPSNNKKKK